MVPNRAKFQKNLLRDCEKKWLQACADVKMYGWADGRTNNHEIMGTFPTGSPKKKRLISKTKVRKERKSDTGWTNISDPGHTRFRSSHRRCSVRKAVLRNFAKFTRKHLCQSLFFNKVLGWPATLLKRKLWNRCFSVNFEKLLRISFLHSTSGRLLLRLLVSNIYVLQYAELPTDINILTYHIISSTLLKPRSAN